MGMTLREIYFKSIEAKLQHLVNSIKVNGRLNLLDGHLFAEPFFAQLLIATCGRLVTMWKVLAPLIKQR